MRIAYLIQNHRPPRQAERLITALRRGGDCRILLCHDEFAGLCSADALRAELRVEVLTVRRPVRRGYLSMIEPYFDGVRHLAESGEAYDWLVYLSAQDYPIRPVVELARLLERTAFDGFLRHWPAFGNRNPWGRLVQGDRRYGFQYFEAPRWTRPALRLLRGLNGIQDLMHVHLVYGGRLGLRRAGSPFRDGYGCWAGTQWSVLRRAAAEAATESFFAAAGPRAWFERTICPDEAVVQTVLLNSGRFSFTDDDLRFVDFTGSRDGHPRLLSSADLPRLAESGKHFARKFDFETDRDVLDRLDELIA
jgi:hypothetical protein